MNTIDNIIIGAGPAGLGCAYKLSNFSDSSFRVIEKEDSPGGLCRTLNYNGYLFDIGGHRFLSDNDSIKELWKNLLGEDMLSVNRSSRIYFKNKYFEYPMSFIDILKKIHPLEGFNYILSYINSKIIKKDVVNFETWIENKFGKKLYDTFFKQYTEKVWGLPCKEMSAELAQERIGGLSLTKTIMNAFFGSRAKNDRSMYNKFLYPRKGPGSLFKKLEEESARESGEFVYKRKVIRINYKDKKVVSVLTEDADNIHKEELLLDHLFSSMPLQIFISSMYPKVNEDILEASKRLLFRNFISVNIIVDKKDVFLDQWIYVNSLKLKLGRIQNYKNWSSSMVKDDTKTSLGLEYFCSEKDDIWNMPDDKLIKYATDELYNTGIVADGLFVDGFVIKCQDAYPVYSINYRRDLNKVMEFLSQFDNLSLIGRQGTFQYCNSDQALLSGMIAAEKRFK